MNTIGRITLAMAVALGGLAPAATAQSGGAGGGVAREPGGAEPSPGAEREGSAPREEEAAAALGRALELFERGLETRPDDPEAARALFEQAAAGMGRARELAGVRNHRLLLNLGNAHLLANNTGRGVLSLRRAERLRPTNPRIQAALAHARAQVGAPVAPSAGERVRMALLAWRGWVPRGVLTWILIGGYASLWALAIGRRLGMGTVGPRAAVAVGVVTGAALGMLWLDHAMMVETDDGVVVAPGGVTGRNGPSEGVYEPSFEDPLPAGLEVRLLERRDGWVRVRLRDGRETWIPVDAMEAI